MQEALLAGARQWPRTASRPIPRGWLIQAAVAPADRRSCAATPRGAPREEPVAARATARRRRRRRRRDDTLILLFLCCHPALTPASAIALTLRAVGGLTTAEIAARVPGARGDDGPADQPGEAAHHGARTRRSGCRPRTSGRRGCASVLHVLYLMFNEGYAGSAGDDAAPRRPLRRGDPADRGWCTPRCPTTPRSAGLLALMLLTDARRPARDRRGRRARPARRQDRARWDRRADRRGHVAAVTAAPADRRRDAASTSCRRPSPPSTTRPPTRGRHRLARRSSRLYELLEQLTGNPVVRSTAPWPPRWWTARPPAWRCSRMSTRPCRRTTAP